MDPRCRFAIDARVAIPVEIFCLGGIFNSLLNCYKIILFVNHAILYQLFIVISVGHFFSIFFYRFYLFCPSELPTWKH